MQLLHVLGHGGGQSHAQTGTDTGHVPSEVLGTVHLGQRLVILGGNRLDCL